MKKFILLLLVTPLLAFAQKTPQGATYPAQILRITDGDTVVIAAPFLPAPFKPELGDILINGQSLRAALIANGFAREYYGEAKQSWCN